MVRRRLRALLTPVVEVVLPRRVSALKATHPDVPANAPTVQEEHDLGRIGRPVPERKLTPIGTLTVTARHDLLPDERDSRCRGTWPPVTQQGKRRAPTHDQKKGGNG
ncbi:hypothetical protein Adu01nite_30990 [Paractinoplanes durhamensis]|uniref:Secreted protein n=1 Tax=Paractinoplanes durhamensis TaxID=113563 RepID=A0ABQ3YW79_9ACTN|nr:hypothetical protein Adu01nite_30990 [Actinoplanes durhamensis]